MATNTSSYLKSQTPGAMPLRAIVEIVDGELKIFPVADSDIDAQGILDMLRFMIKHQAQR